MHTFSVKLSQFSHKQLESRCLIQKCNKALRWDDEKDIHKVEDAILLLILTALLEAETQADGVSDVEGHQPRL